MRYALIVALLLLVSCAARREVIVVYEAPARSEKIEAFRKDLRETLKRNRTDFERMMNGRAQ